MAFRATDLGAAVAYGIRYTCRIYSAKSTTIWEQHLCNFAAAAGREISRWESLPLGGQGGCFGKEIMRWGLKLVWTEKEKRLDSLRRCRAVATLKVRLI